MNKTKVISSVLTASIILSCCGCSLFDQDNKNVLAAANAYADAVVSGEISDVIELMADGEDFEDELTDYVESSEKLEDVYDAILNSMSYEIDQKSVTSSKKNGEASVDITYTLVDYEAVYDDVTEDGGDFDDYVEALEDNDGEDVIEITQTVNFVLDGSKWLVKDKKCKNLYKVYEFYSAVKEYGWSGMIKAVTLDEFEAACIKAFGSEEHDGYISSGDPYGDSCDYGYYYGENATMVMYVYKDPADAVNEFEFFYRGFQSDVSDGYFDGDSAFAFNETDGVVVFEGIWYGDYAYGAYYLKDNTMLYCYTYTDKDSGRAIVDAFFRELGYPGPKDYLK